MNLALKRIEVYITLLHSFYEKHFYLNNYKNIFNSFWLANTKVISCILLMYLIKSIRWMFYNNNIYETYTNISRAYIKTGQITISELRSTVEKLKKQISEEISEKIVIRDDHKKLIMQLHVSLFSFIHSFFFLLFMRFSNFFSNFLFDFLVRF